MARTAMTAEKKAALVEARAQTIEQNGDLYDIAWKFTNGECYVIRRDGAPRGGEE